MLAVGIAASGVGFNVPGAASVTAPVGVDVWGCGWEAGGECVIGAHGLALGCMVVEGVMI